MDNATTLVKREASEGEPSSHTHLPGFEYPGEQGVRPLAVELCADQTATRKTGTMA